MDVFVITPEVEGLAVNEIVGGVFAAKVNEACVNSLPVGFEAT
jgi:hypothetical protein